MIGSATVSSDKIRNGFDHEVQVGLLGCGGRFSRLETVIPIRNVPQKDFFGKLVGNHFFRVAKGVAFSLQNQSGNTGGFQVFGSQFVRLSRGVKGVAETDASGYLFGVGYLGSNSAPHGFSTYKGFLGLK